MNTYKFIVNTLSKRGYLTLLALLIAITTFGQEITVNGVVIDETETPLIGATVQVKNTQKGVVTDFFCVVILGLKNVNLNNLSL